MYPTAQNSNRLTTTDRDNRVQKCVYDPRNRKTQCTDDFGGLNALTQYTYDAGSNLQLLVDAQGNTTKYTYDDANRKTQAIYGFSSAVAQTWGYSYKPAGQLDTLTKADGVTITHAYNNRDWLASKTYSSGAAAPDTFTYYKTGLMKATVSGIYGNTVDRSTPGDYDAANRLIKDRQNPAGVTGTVQYVYTPDDLNASITYPSGTLIEHTYTAQRFLDVTKRNGTTIADQDYDSVGRMTQRTLGNGTQSVYSYDADSRITQINHRKTADFDIQGLGYTYSDEGDPLSQSDLTTAGRDETYSYDGLHRLTGFQRGTAIPPGSTQTWNLDLVGNWGQTVIDGAPETSTHNALNQLTSRSTLAKPIVYDANGNQTFDGDHQGYVYDPNNKLKHAFTDDGAGGGTAGNGVQDGAEATIADCAYDALGRRTLRTAAAGVPNGEQRVYWYDNQRAVQDDDASGSATPDNREYAFANYIDDAVLLTSSAHGNLYYHRNRIFSTFTLTDAASAVQERYQYEAYGKLTTFAATYTAPQAVSRLGNPLTFTAREQDCETELMYYRSRMYDTAQGRFYDRDSIEYASRTANLYEYVTDNPLAGGDPYGYDGPTSQPAAKPRAVNTLDPDLQALYDGLVSGTPEIKRLNDAIEKKTGAPVCVKRGDPDGPCKDRAVQAYYSPSDKCFYYCPTPAYDPNYNTAITTTHELIHYYDDVVSMPKDTVDPNPPAGISPDCAGSLCREMRSYYYSGDAIGRMDPQYFEKAVFGSVQNHCPGIKLAAVIDYVAKNRDRCLDPKSDLAQTLHPKPAVIKPKVLVPTNDNKQGADRCRQ